MPLILGTNSIKDIGYDVANSLRFNPGSSDTLSKLFGTPTNNKKFPFPYNLEDRIRYVRDKFNIYEKSKTKILSLLFLSKP